MKTLIRIISLTVGISFLALGSAVAYGQSCEPTSGYQLSANISGVDLVKKHILLAAKGAECPPASGKYCSAAYSYCCYSSSKSKYYCAKSLSDCKD